MTTTMITIKRSEGPLASPRPARRTSRKRFDPKRQMRRREIAERLGVLIGYVSALMRRGELPAPKKVGAAYAFDRREAMRAIREIRKRHARKGPDGFRGERRPAPWGTVREDPFTIGDVARILDLSVDAVRTKARCGEIAGVWKSQGRLWFEPESVRRYCAELKRKRDDARSRPRTLKVHVGTGTSTRAGVDRATAP